MAGHIALPAPTVAKRKTFRFYRPDRCATRPLPPSIGRSLARAPPPWRLVQRRRGRLPARSLINWSFPPSRHTCADCGPSASAVDLARFDRSVLVAARDRNRPQPYANRSTPRRASGAVGRPGRARITRAQLPGPADSRAARLRRTLADTDSDLPNPTIGDRRPFRSVSRFVCGWQGNSSALL